MSAMTVESILKRYGSGWHYLAINTFFGGGRIGYTLTSINFRFQVVNHEFASLKEINNYLAEGHE